MSYFDIKSDLEIMNPSGFFCLACAVGKPMSEASPDPRYCKGCYGLLLKEAELLSASKRPGWTPKPCQKPQNQSGGNKKQYHISRGKVLKKTAKIKGGVSQ